jgi:hypothetical protein
MIEEDFERGFLGEGGEIDGGRRGDEFKMAGNGGASNASEGAAENEFEGSTFDIGAGEVVAQVVKNGAGDISGKGPLFVACADGGLLKGENQPGLIETSRGSTWDSHQRQGFEDGIFSEHRDFLLR